MSIAQTTCQDIVRAHMFEIRAERGMHSTPWAENHLAAWSSNRPIEACVRRLLEAFAQFCDAHATEDRQVGQDGYFGDYATDMCEALLHMLNLDCGRFDCGSLDKLIRKVANAAQIDLEK